MKVYVVMHVEGFSDVRNHDYSLDKIYGYRIFRKEKAAKDFLDEIRKDIEEEIYDETIEDMKDNRGFTVRFDGSEFRQYNCYHVEELEVK